METEQDLNGQNNQENKKAKSNKPVVLIIIALVIILAGLGCGYAYYQNFQNKDNDDNTLDNECNCIENNIDNTISNNKPNDSNVYKIAKWNGNSPYTPSKSFYKEYFEEIKYFNAATLETGETVIRATDLIWSADIFLVDKNNKITLLGNYSYAEENLISEIKIDKKITIPEKQSCSETDSGNKWGASKDEQWIECK